MKKILLALNVVIWSLVTYQVAHAETHEKVCKVNFETKKETCTKKVCRIDENSKKEICKVIKVHKKLEGAPVPEKDKKK